MARSYLDTRAPIVALATAPGRAALALIRLSGSGSISLASPCFAGRRALESLPGFGSTLGFFQDPDSRERIDQVMATAFKGPRSYTGEDSVEISCHGSPAVVSRILSVLESRGFSPALPGEFSFRAFYNGKLDLVEAEAVNELSGALCENARKDALSRLSGRLSSAISETREACLDLLANVESRLDYPEEEGPEDSRKAYSIAPQLDLLVSRLAELADGFSASRLRTEGASVVLAGRPNAGKSSLFNSLVREERAIVSPEPGTTRDWIESWIELGGWALRLIDTAGLRDAGEGVEAEGVRRSLGRAEEADILVYLADGSAGLSDEDRVFLDAHPRSLRVWNKMDRDDCRQPPPGWIGASVRRPGGIAALERELIRLLGSMAELPGSRGGAMASPRQKTLVDRALSILGAARTQEASGASLDVLALSLREAAAALGEITGEYPSEAVLERIFGSFCLGK